MILVHVFSENSCESKEDYNLAVKMMFNYGLASNANVIFEGMQKEAVPARFFDEKIEKNYLQKGYVQENFDGSNTDGSFTMAVSNSFLSPLEKKSYSCKFGLI